MAHKKLRFDTDARRAIEAGVNKLANAVRTTLGPKGQYVVLHKPLISPTITNDGVTIAQEIDLGDIFENQAAQLVKEVAFKTNDVAGDGTTTALILAQSIIHEGIKNVAAGANPVFLRRGIEKAAEVAVRAILDSATEVEGRDEHGPRWRDLGALGGGRQRHRRRHGEGRQGRGRKRRGGTDPRDATGVHRGDAVRQGLCLPAIRDGRGDGWRPC